MTKQNDFSPTARAALTNAHVIGCGQICQAAVGQASGRAYLFEVDASPEGETVLLGATPRGTPSDAHRWSNAIAEAGRHSSGAAHQELRAIWAWRRANPGL